MVTERVPLFVLLTLFSFVGWCADAEHLAMVRSYVESKKSSEFFIQIPSESWAVSARFFDFNGDGRTEALMGHTDRADLQFVWWGRDGKLICQDTPLLVDDANPCYSEGLSAYAVRFSGGVSRLVLLDALSYDSRTNHVQTSFRTNILCTVNSKFQLNTGFLKNGFDDLVRNPGFESLERIDVEVYAGHELKLISESSCSTNGATALAAGYLLPIGFEKFIQQYRAKIKREKNVNCSMTVFAIFLDANQDGDMDCYVSSSLHETQNGEHEWTLYLKNKDVYSVAEKPIWIFDRTEVRAWGIAESRVTAARNAFYQVVYHPFSSFEKPSTIVLLDWNASRLHSRTCRDYIPAELYRKRPNRRCLGDGDSEFRNWASLVKTQVGYLPPYDFQEIISDACFHRLERLPCLEFHEDH